MEKKTGKSSPKSISTKVINSLIISLFIIMTLNGLVSFYAEKEAEKRRFNEIADQITKRLEHNLITPVWEYSLDQIATVIELEMGNKNILAIIFREKWDTFTIGKIKNNDWKVVDFNTSDPFKQRLEGNYIHRTRKVYKGDEELGTLDLYITNHFLNKQLKKFIYMTIFQITLLLIFSGIVLFFRLNKIVLQPISDLNHIVKNMITKGDAFSRNDEYEKDDKLDSINKIRQSNDEIGTLFNNFMTMNDTIRHTIEQLQLIDKLKDEFLANTSHELRTPLNGIIGLADSLLDESQGELTKGMKEDLTLIIASGKRLAGLVNDILDYSRLKNKDLILNLKPIDIKVIVDLVLLLLNPLIKNKNIKLLNRITDDIPTVLADENRLQQIIYNLVGNSIKFTEEGSVEISAEKKNGEVKIDITDTGIGIPQDKFDTIFKSFEQIDGSLTREYGGAGLGLAITKQLIHLHKGDISLSSTIGKGSTFSFTLQASGDASDVDLKRNDISRLHFPFPFKKRKLFSQESEEQDKDTRRANGTADHRVTVDDCADPQTKILIVDDEAVNLHVLSNFLTKKEYRLFMASSGLEAIDIMNTVAVPDIILLDVMMPKMSGLDLCQTIRQDYSPAELPIILLTAKNQVEGLISGFDSGANDYLVKPFSKKELLARLNTQIKILKQHRDLKDKTRLEKEMEIAKNIQTAILPEIPENNDLEIQAVMQPADEVGGDYYDIMYDKNNDFWVAIGDVTGHGVTSGLIMMMAQSSFSAMLKCEDLTPKDALVCINLLLNENIRSRLKETHYMTMLLLKYTGNGGFIGCGAGHTEIIIYRNKLKKCEVMDLGGFYLGVNADIAVTLDEKKIQLYPKDIMILYTDGLLESRKQDASGDLLFFDKNNIMDIMEKNAEKPLEYIRDQLLDKSLAWCGNNPMDDIAMILIRIRNSTMEFKYEKP